MEKSKPLALDIASACKNAVNFDTTRKPVVYSSSTRSVVLPFEKKKPQRLVNLCIEVLGQHFEDIIADISEIAVQLPIDVKLVLLAIARRRQLLNDNVLIALSDYSWDIVDISGSDATDVGLSKVAQMCSNLQAIDISRCDKITVAGVTDVLCHCHSLATLRCGGSPRSDFTARRCLSILKPKLIDVDGDSWEELESVDINNGPQSLRWLVWPKIDEESKLSLARESPRICVNPQGPIGIGGVQVPVEALHSIPLDSRIVEDINPKTWAVSGASHLRKAPDASVQKPEMPIAERFRLAFLERDARLAQKRAKNVRQHRRREEREWLMSDTSSKSIFLASQANKHLYNKK
ncbi:hypothetical protein HPP92_012873 [Vanilla planifolia]|uniref:RNI-like superfamily protein n=1 Tax=Vanilla planifolia TaxID=51239 RepID=A0A835QXP0_VANPL|nr:hypothetical protein HPP92_012873 [Vanilla planifolia]